MKNPDSFSASGRIGSRIMGHHTAPIIFFQVSLPPKMEFSKVQLCDLTTHPLSRNSPVS